MRRVASSPTNDREPAAAGTASQPLTIGDENASSASELVDLAREHAQHGRLGEAIALLAATIARYPLVDAFETLRIYLRIARVYESEAEALRFAASRVPHLSSTLARWGDDRLRYEPRQAGEFFFAVSLLDPAQTSFVGSARSAFRRAARFDVWPGDAFFTYESSCMTAGALSGCMSAVALMQGLSIWSEIFERPFGFAFALFVSGAAIATGVWEAAFSLAFDRALDRIGGRSVIYVALCLSLSAVVAYGVLVYSISGRPEVILSATVAAVGLAYLPAAKLYGTKMRIVGGLSFFLAGTALTIAHLLHGIEYEPAKAFSQGVPVLCWIGSLVWAMTVASRREEVFDDLTSAEVSKELGERVERRELYSSTPYDTASARKRFNGKR